MSETPAPTGPSDLLTPESRAVAGLALAFAALLGPNALTAGFQILFMSGPEAGDPGLYGVLSGFAAAVPAGLAIYLARPVTRSGAQGWAAQLARAAVVVAGVALLGVVLMVVGGFLLF